MPVDLTMCTPQMEDTTTTTTKKMVFGIGGGKKCGIREATEQKTAEREGGNENNDNGGKGLVQEAGRRLRHSKAQGSGVG